MRQVPRHASYCWDASSGFYYLSARYCDPSTTQFITKDPAKADGEESAYQYCAGNPVGKTDSILIRWTGPRTSCAPPFSIGLQERRR
jgi:RHS repeat-associated protein